MVEKLVLHVLNAGRKGIGQGIAPSLQLTLILAVGEGLIHQMHVISVVRPDIGQETAHLRK